MARSLYKKTKRKVAKTERDLVVSGSRIPLKSDMKRNEQRVAWLLVAVRRYKGRASTMESTQAHLAGDTDSSTIADSMGTGFDSAYQYDYYDDYHS